MVPGILTVSEIARGLNTGDVRISIPKHPYLELLFDETLTSHNGQDVSNADWELDASNPGEYRFKYIGTDGNFPNYNFSKIGITIKVSPDTGTSGEIDFTTELKSGSGDTNPANDSDVAKIGYDN